MKEVLEQCYNFLLSCEAFDFISFGPSHWIRYVYERERTVAFSFAFFGSGYGEGRSPSYMERKRNCFVYTSSSAALRWSFVQQFSYFIVFVSLKASKKSHLERKKSRTNEQRRRDGQKKIPITFPNFPKAKTLTGLGLAGHGLPFNVKAEAPKLNVNA